MFCKTRLRTLLPAKRPKLRSLISIVKYKIFTNPKTKNRKKKTHRYKNSNHNNAHLSLFGEKKYHSGKKYYLSKKWALGQFQSILWICPLLKKVEFLRRQLGVFGRLWRPNAIWFWGGKGVCRSVVGTGPIFLVLGHTS